MRTTVIALEPKYLCLKSYSSKRKAIHFLVFHISNPLSLKFSSSVQQSFIALSLRKGIERPRNKQLWNGNQRPYCEATCEKVRKIFVATILFFTAKNFLKNYLLKKLHTHLTMKLLFPKGSSFSKRVSTLKSISVNCETTRVRVMWESQCWEKSGTCINLFWERYLNKLIWNLNEEQKSFLFTDQIKLSLHYITEPILFSLVLRHVWFKGQVDTHGWDWRWKYHNSR